MLFRNFIACVTFLLHSLQVTAYSQATYVGLVEIVEWCAVSYCVTNFGELDIINNAPDLITGPLNLACPLMKFCQDNPEVEIVSILNPVITEFQIAGSGFIALDHTHQKIIVAFRGSATVGDWLTDFNFLMVPYIPITNNIKLVGYKPCLFCTLHKGVYYAMKGLMQQVLPVLDSLIAQYPDYQLITTGHSLGGGLTTLAGVEFQLMGYKPTVYSYAGLKIGNVPFASFIDKIFNSAQILANIQNGQDFSTMNGYVRVVHKGDIVPLVPPTPLYAHGGVEFYIDKLDLPQPQSVTQLKGLYVYEPLVSQLLNILSGNSPAEWLTIAEHLDYFVNVYGCNATTSIAQLLPGLTKRQHLSLAEFVDY